MNKQEVIRIIQREQFQVPYGPGIFVHAVFSDKAIELINQIHEPQIKYMAEINHLYYELKNRHKPKPQKHRPTFCQLTPLDKASWKAEIESPVIAWK